MLRENAVFKKMIATGEERMSKIAAQLLGNETFMGALQKATVAHVFDMRAVLTPEQAKAFDAEVIAALTQEGR